MTSYPDRLLLVTCLELAFNYWLHPSNYDLSAVVTNNLSSGEYIYVAVTDNNDKNKDITEIYTSQADRENLSNISEKNINSEEIKKSGEYQAENPEKSKETVDNASDKVNKNENFIDKEVINTGGQEKPEEVRSPANNSNFQADRENLPNISEKNINSEEIKKSGEYQAENPEKSKDTVNNARDKVNKNENFIDKKLDNTGQQKPEEVRSPANNSTNTPKKTSTTDNNSKKSTTNTNTKKSWKWWVLGGIAIFSGAGGLLLMLKNLGKDGDEIEGNLTVSSIISSDLGRSEIKLPTENGLNSSINILNVNNQTNGYNHKSSLDIAEKSVVNNNYPKANTTEKSELSNTNIPTSGRLPKIDIVDELIKELNNLDPSRRRKVIWDLGQRGDSRAVQPLVNLLVDSDSQQRSLILAALSEISIRTLKPMNRALAISLQDESPEVRKNAIRDLIGIYELVFQISHLINNAIDDSNTDVRETAIWALHQLNRIRSMSGSVDTTVLQNRNNIDDNSRKLS